MLAHYLPLILHYWYFLKVQISNIKKIEVQKKIKEILHHSELSQKGKTLYIYIKHR